MFLVVNVSVRAAQGSYGDAANELLRLGAQLEQEWLVAVGSAMLHGQHRTGDLVLSGILAHERGLVPDIERRATESLSSYAMKGRVKVTIEELPASEDYGYADMAAIREIELCCDPFWGLPPIRCRDTHRIVRANSVLPADLHTELWNWDHHYRLVYRLWEASGNFEMWAAEQLSDANAWLNVEGHRLSQSLHQALGRPVVYVPMSREEATKDIDPS